MLFADVGTTKRLRDAYCCFRKLVIHRGFPCLHKHVCVVLSCVLTLGRLGTSCTWPRWGSCQPTSWWYPFPRGSVGARVCGQADEDQPPAAGTLAFASKRWKQPSSSRHVVGSLCARAQVTRQGVRSCRKRVCTRVSACMRLSVCVCVCMRVYACASVWKCTCACVRAYTFFGGGCLEQQTDLPCPKLH